MKMEIIQNPKVLVNDWGSVLRGNKHNVVEHMLMHIGKEKLD